MIKFVRVYRVGNCGFADVVYTSNRVVTYSGNKSLPKTVLKFLANSTGTEYYDDLYQRDEVIYEIVK